MVEYKRALFNKEVVYQRMSNIHSHKHELVFTKETK